MPILKASPIFPEGGPCVFVGTNQIVKCHAAAKGLVALGFETGSQIRAIVCNCLGQPAPEISRLPAVLQVGQLCLTPIRGLESIPCDLTGDRRAAEPDEV